MDLLIVLATSLIFYFIGRYSQQPLDTEALLKKAKRLLRPKGGVIINYPTAEEQIYSGSEREKIDIAQTKLMKEAGIV